jgi:hypothetical protein
VETSTNASQEDRTENSVNLWTFEHGKFKVLRIYMDIYPYRQALSHVLGSSDE